MNRFPSERVALQSGLPLRQRDPRTYDWLLTVLHSLRIRALSAGEHHACYQRNNDNIPDEFLYNTTGKLLLWAVTPEACAIGGVIHARVRVLFCMCSGKGLKPNWCKENLNQTYQTGLEARADVLNDQLVLKCMQTCVTIDKFPGKYRLEALVVINYVNICWKLGRFRLACVRILPWISVKWCFPPTAC